MHRDFKPSNAILDDDGRVRVLDFGLARTVGMEPSPATDRQAVSETSALEADLTRTGSVMGTLAYMAPEQRRGESASEASDQFSFFVVLYEAIYGERPYPRDTAGIVLGGEVEVRAPNIDVSAPSGLRSALLRGVAVEPSQRFGSMNEGLDVLASLVSPSRSRWLVAAAAAAVAVGGVGMAQHAEVGFRCEGAASSIEEVWGDAQRDEARGALTSADAPYAEGTWSRVSAKLDAYGQSWAKQHTAACEASRVTQTQPESVLAQRMACLEGRRTALREAIAVLQRGGDGALYASQVVAHLPSLARCADIEALQSDLPLPTEPAVAAEVAELRRALVEVRALRDAAALDESEALADQTLDAARALGYEPVVAEAAMFLPEGDLDLWGYQKWVGRTLVKLERYDEARIAFGRVYATVVAAVGDAHYDLVPALMELAELELREGKRARARTLVAQAQAAFVDIGGRFVVSVNMTQQWLDQHPG